MILPVDNGDCGAMLKMSYQFARQQGAQKLRAKRRSQALKAKVGPEMAQPKQLRGQGGNKAKEGSIAIMNSSAT